MIILKTLAWSNCFSYGEGNEIDLSKATLTQLVGTNGVGKSSIPLILEKYYSIKTVKILRKPILLTDMLIRVTISVLAFLLIATIMLSLLAVGQILNAD